MKTAENLIETLCKIKDKKAKLELTLLFIEEIGGTLTHLQNTGLMWGAAAEETRSGREFLKYTKIMADLKNIVFNLKIEKDKTYHDDACRRVEKSKSQGVLF